jgi:hypothetical protein
MNSATTSFPPQSGKRALAPVATSLSAWFGRIRRSIWIALEESGRARARRELLDFAERCEAHQPELAKELRVAAGHDALV